MSDIPQPLVAPLEFRGKTYYVRELNGKGRAAVRKVLNEPESEAREARLSILGLCTEDGKLKYTSDSVTELAEGSGDFLGAVVAKLFEVSGLAVKAGEEAEKN